MVRRDPSHDFYDHRKLVLERILRALEQEKQRGKARR